MFKNLNAGAIGIRNYSLEDTLKLAQQTGFGGIDFSIQEATQLGADVTRTLFEQYDCQYGAWGLPVAWRDNEKWQSDLQALPALAETALAMGAMRTATWCPPSGDMAFDENFQWHVDRFGAIAEVLKPYDIRFAIEFIGPQTLRPPEKQAFIYTMEGMLDLINAIGTDNMGLLLDAWHLYTSGGSLDDLDKITNDDVIVVHVNDAPQGLTMATYIDQDRRLPMETGVMDLPGFMGKLKAMNYDGPVTPEPFSKRLNSLDDPQEAARITATYMDKMWQASGLSS